MYRELTKDELREEVIRTRSWYVLEECIREHNSKQLWLWAKVSDGSQNWVVKDLRNHEFKKIEFGSDFNAALENFLED